MEQIAIRELNQHTSRVLARVRAGETVEVTDRGEPIARLVPIVVGDALLARLVAEGRATAPTAADATDSSAARRCEGRRPAGRQPRTGLTAAAVG